MIEDDKVHSQKLQDALYQWEGEYYCKKFYGRLPRAEKLMADFSSLMPSALEDGNWESKKSQKKLKNLLTNSTKRGSILFADARKMASTTDSKAVCITLITE